MRELLLFVFLFVSATIQASPTYIVECSVTHNSKLQVVQFKMNSYNKIIDWDKNHYAKNIKGDLFQIFGEDLDTSAVESKSSFVAPNGYSIISLTTTADNETIGIYLTGKTGFYQYKDYGSGNGNSKPIPLSCYLK